MGHKAEVHRSDELPSDGTDLDHLDITSRIDLPVTASSSIELHDLGFNEILQLSYLYLLRLRYPSRQKDAIPVGLNIAHCHQALVSHSSDVVIMLLFKPQRGALNGALQ